MVIQKQGLDGKLIIGNLSLRNLQVYKRKILAGERIFHQNIKLTSQVLENILRGKSTIGKVALFDTDYIGNAIGFSPSTEQIKEEELLGLNENPASIYIYNMVIEPKFQRRGYGTRLLREFIEECRSKGYEFLEGHFRNGPSLHIAKKLGAKPGQVYHGWQGTEEDYTHCKLVL